jgi:hypothetical protein
MRAIEVWAYGRQFAEIDGEEVDVGQEIYMSRASIPEFALVETELNRNEGIQLISLVATVYRVAIENVMVARASRRSKGILDDILAISNLYEIINGLAGPVAEELNQEMPLVERLVSHAVLTDGGGGHIRKWIVRAERYSEQDLRTWRVEFSLRKRCCSRLKYLRM